MLEEYGWKYIDLLSVLCNKLGEGNGGLDNGSSNGGCEIIVKVLVIYEW